jgi:ubiquinone/menaquinone biosynthesis C-methylase UbiE
VNLGREKAMTTQVTPGNPSTVSALFSGAPNFAEMYERHLVGPIFRPWAAALLERIALPVDGRVLDVACGTGIVARLARERLGAGAVIVGVDKSPLMLATAREIDPGIEWREGDALALPVPEGEQFDVALCHQGVQFFPDRLAGVREMRRVLAEGGHVGIGVWRPLDENGVFATLGRIAERFVGPIHDMRHSFGDADSLRQLLIDAGFEHVRVEAVSMRASFRTDPALLARLNAMAVIGMSERGKSASDEERGRIASSIVEASLPELARFVEEGVIYSPMAANIATAKLV